MENRTFTSYQGGLTIVFTVSLLLGFQGLELYTYTLTPLKLSAIFSRNNKFTTPRSISKQISRINQPSTSKHGADNRPRRALQTCKHISKFYCSITSTPDTRRLAAMETNHSSTLQKCASSCDHPGDECCASLRLVSDHWCPAAFASSNSNLSLN